ncbi:MAG: GLPGLI family protein [Bacteroidales bacterium]|nr:GLPGLI family protein [Bacteroidales bacterium]
MNYKLFFFFVFLFLSCRQEVSKDTLGTSTHRFQYACKYKRNSLKKGYHNDLFFLDWGNNTSRFYSRIEYLKDSTRTAMLAAGEKIVVIQEALSVYGYGNKYVIVKTPEEIVFSDRLITSRFYYKEPAPDFQWSLKQDTCSILGYPCQKAVCQYGGRVWTAWFTTQIPISDGPYKFSGLPGLILRTSDEDQFFIFEITGVENCQVPLLQAYDHNYNKIDKEHYLQISYRVWTENFDPSGNVKSFSVRDVQGRDVTNVTIPYIHIELF